MNRSTFALKMLEAADEKTDSLIVDNLFSEIDNPTSIATNLVPSTSKSRSLILKGSVSVAAHIGANSTDPEILDIGARKSTRKTVRRAVAGNPHMSKETALYLLKWASKQHDESLFQLFSYKDFSFQELYDSVVNNFGGGSLDAPWNVLVDKFRPSTPDEFFEVFDQCPVQFRSALTSSLSDPNRFPVSFEDIVEHIEPLRLETPRLHATMMTVLIDSVPRIDENVASIILDVFPKGEYYFKNYVVSKGFENKKITRKAALLFAGSGVSHYISKGICATTLSIDTQLSLVETSDELVHKTLASQPEVPVKVQLAIIAKAESYFLRSLINQGTSSKRVLRAFIARSKELVGDSKVFNRSPWDELLRMSSVLPSEERLDLLRLGGWDLTERYLRSAEVSEEEVDFIMKNPLGFFKQQRYNYRNNATTYDDFSTLEEVSNFLRTQPKFFYNLDECSAARFILKRMNAPFKVSSNAARAYCASLLLAEYACRPAALEIALSFALDWEKTFDELVQTVELLS